MKDLINKLFLALLLTMDPVVAGDNEQAIQGIYADSLKQIEQGKVEVKKWLGSMDPKRIKQVDDASLGLKQSQEGTRKAHPNRSCPEKTCKAKVINVPPSSHSAEKSVVLVFVTLSMPDETLRTLSRDVSRVGGRLIIRGLTNNSFPQTQKRLLDLGITVDIDPPLFEQFQVREVPAFVHVEVRQGEYSPAYDCLKGNVTLAYALEQLSEKGTIAAQALLSKLKGST